MPRRLCAFAVFCAASLYLIYVRISFPFWNPHPESYLCTNEMITGSKTVSFSESSTAF